MISNTAGTAPRHKIPKGTERHRKYRRKPKKTETAQILRDNSKRSELVPSWPRTARRRKEIEGHRRRPTDAECDRASDPAAVRKQESSCEP